MDFLTTFNENVVADILASQGRHARDQIKELSRELEELRRMKSRFGQGNGGDYKKLKRDHDHVNASYQDLQGDVSRLHREIKKKDNQISKQVHAIEDLKMQLANT